MYFTAASSLGVLAYGGHAFNFLIPTNVVFVLFSEFWTERAKMAAKPPIFASNKEDEYCTIVYLFFSVKPASRYSLGGPKAEYNLAAEYGALAKDEVACQIRYQECPYTADQMMATLRSSNL